MPSTELRNKFLKTKVGESQKITQKSDISVTLFCITKMECYSNLVEKYTKPILYKNVSHETICFQLKFPADSAS